LGDDKRLEITLSQHGQLNIDAFDSFYTPLAPATEASEISTCPIINGLLYMIAYTSSYCLAVLLV